MMHMRTRREFLAAATTGILAMGGLNSCSGQSSNPPRGRVVILGFDGMDPKLSAEMMDAGELPNLAKLRAEGSFLPLRSTIPPQSPTAWSSFMTCRNPGGHGVYDFLRRTPSNYMPGVGFGAMKQPNLSPEGALLDPAAFNSLRKGKTFWKALDEQGTQCKVLNIPFAFPADDMLDSHMLCGCGVPDIRGTQSMFFYWGEEVKEKEGVSGGLKMPLAFSGDSAQANLPGMRDPRTREFTMTPILFKADRAAKKLSITLPDDQTLVLGESEWSPWVEWTFILSDKFRVRAISRFHVLEAGEKCRVYMTCLQFHPKEPLIPFTEPEPYSRELAEKYGLYKTIGWAYDTHAVREDMLPEDAFLEDVRNTMSWHERLTLDEMDLGGFGLLTVGWTGPDRVSHLFWRFRDKRSPLYTEEGHAKYGRAVEDTYTKADAITGEVMAKLQPGDLLMVMSDHGFHSFHTGFNVNTWLIRNGYLAVKGQVDSATAENPESYLEGYDWSQTKAYCLGLGSIYLNIKGREGAGTVAPEDAPALAAEIAAKLREVTHPEFGEKIFNAVYTSEVYHGETLADAPDIQLGYADGYQSTKSAAMGEAPETLFEPNTDKWSGEHAASDVEGCPGVFFSNMKTLNTAPAIIDLGVTALVYLGRNVPTEYEGKPLF